MPENCDAKTLSYVIARHPVYNICDNRYICINDIYYILILYINNVYSL